MTKRNIIVIGTSAGGVEALSELSKRLPENLDASVFVVLHIGDESLKRWSARSERPSAN